MNNLLIKAIQEGIEITAMPFKKIANQCKLSERDLLDEIKSAVESKIIKRFGAVINHRKMGYKSNAMVVWDFPQEVVDEFGKKMSSYEFVRLCYQRPRVPGVWQYNLFCMVFGKSREQIEKDIKTLIDELKIEGIEYKVLFTTKAYKQKGARYR